MLKERQKKDDSRVRDHDDDYEKDRGSTNMVSTDNEKETKTKKKGSRPRRKKIEKTSDQKEEL